MRTKILLSVIFIALSCFRSYGQQAPGHFLLATNMYMSILPNPNVLTFGFLDGITTRFDGYEGRFVAITNSLATIDNINVFGITNSVGQSGRWIRMSDRGSGTNGPVGPAGGALTGTYPNPGVNLSTTTFITGDLPLSNIVQIATATLLGRNTAGTGDIEVITNIDTAITIGGAYIYRVGGTDVIVGDGGTGLSTLTQNGVLFGNGTGAVGITAQGGANTVLVANSGAPSFSAAITVGTSVTSPAIIGTTSITDAGLTATQVVFPGVGGILSGDSDFTFTGGNTLSSPVMIASTSVSTPLITTASGQLLVSPNNGKIALSPTDTNSVVIGGGNPPTQGQGILELIDSSAGANRPRFYLRDTQSDTGWTFQPWITSGDENFQLARIGSSGDFAIPDARTTIGGTTFGAKLAVVGGVRIGAAVTDPGIGNLFVEALTTSATLSITSTSLFTGTLGYIPATDERVAVFAGGKLLASSTVTTTTLAFLDATSSIQTQINTKVQKPIYGSVDPNDGSVGAGTDGQSYIRTNGDRYQYNIVTASWAF